MPDKITPEDFGVGDGRGLTVIDEAHILLSRAANVSSCRVALDGSSAMFILSNQGYKDAIREMCSIGLMKELPAAGGIVQLLGIPARVTMYDAPDTPRVQLVMEPLAAILPPGG